MFNYTFECNEKHAAKLGGLECAFIREALKLLSHYKSVIDGFQAIVQLDDSSCVAHNEETNLLPCDEGYLDPMVARFHLTDGENRGTFAEAKMATLEFFPDLPATGFMDLQEFLKLASQNIDSQHYSEISKMAAYRKIASYDNASQLTKEDHIWLRDNLGLTLYPGGVRIGVIGTKGFQGEVKVTFSGLTQEQDLSLAFLIFKCFQIALTTICGNECGEYVLMPLRTYHHTLAYYLVANDVAAYSPLL